MPDHNVVLADGKRGEVGAARSQARQIDCTDAVGRSVNSVSISHRIIEGEVTAGFPVIARTRGSGALGHRSHVGRRVLFTFIEDRLVAARDMNLDGIVGWLC
jgi:hypothetical protein